MTEPKNQKRIKNKKRKSRLRPSHHSFRKHKKKGNTKCNTSSQSLTSQGLLSLSKHPCFYRSLASRSEFTLWLFTCFLRLFFGRPQSQLLHPPIAQLSFQRCWASPSRYSLAARSSLSLLFSAGGLPLLVFMLAC
jgi:hypothetical protein